MRVLSFLLLISLINPSCTFSFAKIKLDNEKDVRKALSKEWAAIYTETSGRRVKVPKGGRPNIIFSEDGTCSQRVISGSFFIVTKTESNVDPKAETTYVSTGNQNGPMLKNGKIINNAEWNYDPNPHLLYIGTGNQKGSGRVLKLTRRKLILVEHLRM
ncbi:hypothetical protein OCK74_27910, partial [Chitinophagaceae bacterium LB-8]